MTLLYPTQSGTKPLQHQVGGSLRMFPFSLLGEV
jgi:hypothetical protein